MDLTTLSLSELKILGYEQIKLLNQAQHNVRMIEAEIDNREKTPIPLKEEDSQKPL